MKNFQNKFSAILLFAVMALFVSCTEDYQSDIDSLEDRVTALETEVDALQSAIDAGAVITSVTNSNGVTTVTLSDNTSFQIKDGAAGADGAPGAAAPVWTIDDEGYWCEDGKQTDVKAVADEANYYTPEFDEDTMMWSWVEYDAEGEATGETIAMESVPAAVWTDGSLVIYGYNEESGEMETFTFSVFSEIKSLNYIPELYVDGLETVEAFGLHSNVYTLMDPNSLGSFLTTNIFDLEYQVNPSEASTDAFTFGFTSINVTSRAAGTGVLDVFAAEKDKETGILLVSADASEKLDWLYEEQGHGGHLSASSNDTTVDMFALQATAKDGFVAETITSDDYLQVSMTDLYGFVISNPQTYSEEILDAKDRFYYAYVKTLVDAALEELGPCPYVWGDAEVDDEVSVEWDTKYLAIFNPDAEYKSKKAGEYYYMNLKDMDAKEPFSFQDEYDAYVEAYPSISVPNPLFPHAATMEAAKGASINAATPATDDVDPRTRVELVYNESKDLADLVETWWMGPHFVQGYKDLIRPEHDADINALGGPMEVGTADEALKVRSLTYKFVLEEDVVTVETDNENDQNEYVELNGSVLSVKSKYGLGAEKKMPVVTVYAYVNDKECVGQPIAKAYIPVVVVAEASELRSDYVYDSFELKYTYSDIYAIQEQDDEVIGDVLSAALISELSLDATQTIKEAGLVNVATLLTWSDMSAMIGDINEESDADGLPYVGADLLPSEFGDIYGDSAEIQYYDTEAGEWCPFTGNSPKFASDETGTTGLVNGNAYAGNDDGSVEILINKKVKNVNAGAIEYRVIYTLEDDADAYTYPTNIIIPFTLEITQEFTPIAYEITNAYIYDAEGVATATDEGDDNNFAYSANRGKIESTVFTMQQDIEEMMDVTSIPAYYNDGVFYALAPDVPSTTNADGTENEDYEDAIDAREAGESNSYGFKFNYADYTFYADQFNCDGDVVANIVMDADSKVAYLYAAVELANGEKFFLQEFAVEFFNPFSLVLEDLVLAQPSNIDGEAYTTGAVNLKLTYTEDAKTVTLVETTNPYYANQYDSDVTVDGYTYTASEETSIWTTVKPANNNISYFDTTDEDGKFYQAVLYDDAPSSYTVVGTYTYLQVAVARLGGADNANFFEPDGYTLIEQVDQDDITTDISQSNQTITNTGYAYAYRYITVTVTSEKTSTGGDPVITPKSFKQSDFSYYTLASNSIGFKLNNFDVDFDVEADEIVWTGDVANNLLAYSSISALCDGLVSGKTTVDATSKAYTSDNTPASGSTYAIYSAEASNKVISSYFVAEHIKWQPTGTGYLVSMPGYQEVSATVTMGAGNNACTVTFSDFVSISVE